MESRIDPLGAAGAGDPDGPGTFDAVVTNAGGTLCYRLRVAGIAEGRRFHLPPRRRRRERRTIVAFYETGQEPRDDACAQLDPALDSEIASAPAGFYATCTTRRSPPARSAASSGSGAAGGSAGPG